MINQIAWNSRRDRITAIAFLVPATAILAITLLTPLLLSLALSFTHCSRFLTIHPAGLFNYKTILTSRLTLKALRNTLFFTAMFVPSNAVLAISLALLLNESMPGIRLVRLVCFAPVALSGIVAISVFRFVLDPDFGALNDFLTGLGIAPIHWLGSETWAMPSMVMITLWKSSPFFAIILLATMQDIPASLYEAARVDGAGCVRQFLHVTLPSIAPVLITVIALSTIGASRIFEPMYVLTSGGPNDSTQTVTLLAYRTAFQSGDIGLANAICCSLLMFIIVVTLIFNLLSRWVRS
jgi:multiple sugar transport system permease protein